MNTETSYDSTILQALGAESLVSISGSWPEILEKYTESDVRREISRISAPFSFERCATLASPAAGKMLEEMAIAASAITRQRFGRTMNLYAPLYLSNFCTNRCKYCGFNTGNSLERTRLTVDEAVRQGEIIASEGFRDLLLVSGEDRKYVTVEYLSEIARRLRSRFASISIEIFQLEEGEYRQLFEAGIDGVTIYQETYCRETYKDYHLGGAKANYEKRLFGQETAARAGMRRLGIGALLGLEDWRFELLSVAVHAHVLMKNYWRSKVSVSFPRMRPAPEVEVDFPHLVSDRELVQMVTALRICFPDIGLVLSTRESAEFRNNLINLGITQISAGSKTNPGGYDESCESTEQFVIADDRPVGEVVGYLKNHGFDPVWKDWDPSFTHG